MSLRLETFVTGQKRFLGDTAHELCSPLARIRMNLGLLEREIPEAQRERLGELVAELVEREAVGCDVRCEISPALTCQVNREFARRAIGNLLKNAVRYAGGAGPITVSAEGREGSIDLTIADQGLGIPEEWLERIMEPFARPETARTREGGGVGLGLAIAKTCIEALGGRIRLQNGSPKGLIAVLTIPSEVQTNENGSA